MNEFTVKAGGINPKIEVKLPYEHPEMAFAIYAGSVVRFPIDERKAAFVPPIID
jgi:hypothetical protein